MNARGSSPDRSRALIIGYGNPLRGNDAVGWRATELLAAYPGIAADAGVRIETVHQLTPEIAESIASADTVIFIDAAASECDAPGCLRCVEVRAEEPTPQALGHHLTPGLALAYARAVYAASPTAYLASVTAASFDFGAPLSPAVEAAMPALLQWAQAQLKT
jgi:hydrogenase maturation protease